MALISIQRRAGVWRRYRIGEMNERESSQVRWILITWIFVLSAVGYLDRVNISIMPAVPSCVSSS